MLKTLLDKQRENKNMLFLVVAFLFMHGMYTFLDVLGHGGITEMVTALSTPMVMLHQLLNVLMASMAALMLSLGRIRLSLTGKEPTGSTGVPFFSFFFGLLTFGCTPCVVAFFSAIGIAFTPIVFPHGNLLWKVILLLLIGAGFILILRTLNRSVCRMKT